MADAGTRRSARGGGGAARRAERSAVSFETARYIERNIPDFEILTEEALEIIEANAETVLAEIGVNFVHNPAALNRWREAGADVDGERVRLPRGLARKLCATAPSSFTQHARNPDRSVVVGGRSLVLAPVYGPPFVRDAERGRRYATMEDFNNFVKLGYMSKWLHHSGGTVCEPTDLPVNKRHLDMLMAHMTLSDKPFMGSVTEPSRAQDSVEMCEILFGKVGAGDLSARAGPGGPREVGAVAASLDAMAEALEAADEQRRAMVSDVAHELRSPVANLRAYTEAMVDGVAEPTGDDLAVVLDEVHRLDHLIGDLQELALADAGQLRLVLEPVDVREVVERTAAAVAARAAAAGVGVVVDVDVDVAAPLPTVAADRARLRQILVNLPPTAPVSGRSS